MMTGSRDELGSSLKFLGAAQAQGLALSHQRFDREIWRNILNGHSLARPQDDPLLADASSTSVRGF